jgi:predicted amidohydrolase
MITATTTPLRAACAQMRSGRSVPANVDQAVRLVREAAHAGAQLVQTPEMSSLVERDRERLFAAIVPEERDAMLAAMRALAREAGLWLHAGSMAILVGDKVANRGFLIDPAGEVVARYDKVHLYDVDLPNGESWRESRTYTGGCEAVVAETPFGGIGLGICYDVRFGHFYRQMAEAGADILTAPACFTKQTGEAHWHVLQRARAIEFGAFMISAAQAGPHEDGRETFGHSLIVDPWGRVLADGGTEPGIIVADLDMAAVAAARQRIPTLRHARHVPLVRAGAAPSLAAE